MTDEELRSLVREALARHASGGAAAGSVHSSPSVRAHASHLRFVLLPDGADSDGPCLIEPRVACNHCGYCQSYGH